jgi:NAD(P)-dependent dehydrogenase (short-subunit alcohol dehydrogenase family)
LTPDHVIHTKRIAAILGDNPEQSIRDFVAAYDAYFEAHRTVTTKALDPAPRWAVWTGLGTLALATQPKRLQVVHDITEHTVRAVQWAEALGGWTALSARDIFEVEYWELEQAKLNKSGSPSAFDGRVALVTGAASGIGAACVHALVDAGAAVVALDLAPLPYRHQNVLAVQGDVTDPKTLERAICDTVSHFGGLDILISNAGSFPTEQPIEAIEAEDWAATLRLNLTSHQQLLTLAGPFLAMGVEPAVVIVGSKNVTAPGKGVSAYSVAKAGLNQLARVAALEWGPRGIRVNTLHPNAVFDTGLWTEERVQARADHYGIEVETYRSKNILGVEVTAKDVAEMAVAMAGPLFRCTTGSQCPIDGGLDRVI